MCCRPDPPKRKTQFRRSDRLQIEVPPRLKQMLFDEADKKNSTASSILRQLLEQHFLMLEAAAS